MPDFQVKLTRIETVTLNFKAKDEDAAQEKADALVESEIDLKDLPKGWELEEEDTEAWEVEEVYEA